jgi:hypothetical protein
MPRGVLLLFLVLWLPTSSAQADPIPIILITGGTLDVGANRGAYLDINGAGGFRVFEVGMSANSFGVNCLPCAPGELFDFGSALGGIDDQAGTVELDGMSFRIPTDADAPTRFVARAVVPAAGTSGVFSVPFTMIGFVVIFEPGSELEMHGQGTMTVHLRPDHGGPLWEFESARFKFAAPTPEPSTLLLVSGGLAGLVRRRHARRKCGTC